MKNICFCNSTTFWGGGEKLNLDYALEFKKKGYNVFVASHKDSLLFEEAQNAGIAVFHMEVGSFSFLNPFKINALKSYFVKNEIDTVFFSTSEDVKLGAIAAKKAGIKRIVYLRVLAVRIKNSIVNRTIFRDYVTHIIASSEEVKKLAIQYLTDKIIRDKVHVIYLGINLKDFEDQSRSREFDHLREAGLPIIGNAGRLTTQKGQHLLLEVAAKLKANGVKFKLVIAGTGELESELNDRIAKENLQDFVQLLGFVKNIPGFMQSIDVFALSSLWEGFGLVIAEAMAAQKPVVAFDLTSNPEVITRNETGFLVEYPDTTAFAEKLALLCKDENLRVAMGKAGRASVEKNFQVSVVHNQLEKYLLG